MVSVRSLNSLFTGLIFIFAATAALAQSTATSAATPDSPFQRALLHLRDGHFEDALTELTAAEAQSPSDARIRNFRGVTLAQLGRTDEASAEYREAIRLDPRMEDAYRNLGLLEWTEHQLDAAAGDLRHALTLAPNDSFAHYYLGRVLLDSKAYAEALAQLHQSSVPQPEDSEFLAQLVIANSVLGRQEQENKAIQRLIAIQPDAAQSLRVVDLLLSLKRNDAAIHLLQTRMEHQTNVPWIRFDLARTYLIAHDFQNAVAQAHQYIEVSGKDSSRTDLASAWSLLGIAEADLKNSDSAVNAFREATRLQPGDEEYCLNLTRELMDLAHYDDAIAAIQSGIASNPKSYALHLRLGAAYLASGRYPDAESSFRQLVEANDPLPISYVGLAQVLLRVGRADEAVTELTNAELKLGPSFLISYFRGLALKRAGNSSDAASAFAEAVRLNPSSAEARRDYGSTLLSLGKVDESVSELRESLRLAPGDLRTRRLLSRAYARSGDVQRARQNLDTDVDSSAPVTGLQGDFVIPGWQYPPSQGSH